LEHVRHDGSRDQEVAQNVGGEQVAETVRADVPEARRFGHEARVHGAHADAGVVDQHVNATEDRKRAVHASGDRLLVADVHHQPGHPGTAADPAGGILDALPRPAGQDDPGSGFGQRLAHGEAEPAGSPGDERADSLEYRRGPWVRRLRHAADLTLYF
jgi:hypothetical protein